MRPILKLVFNKNFSAASSKKAQILNAYYAMK